MKNYNNGPTITLFTDASHNKAKKACGWGMWARTNDLSIWCGGRFREYIVDSNSTEMAAIVNAVALLGTEGWLKPGEILLIKTDSLTSVLYLTKGSGCESKIFSTYAQALYKLKDKYKFHYWVKHVPGHKGTNEPKFFVNDLCDKLAKRAVVELPPGKMFTPTTKSQRKET